MFSFHKPKIYRSLTGCCICRAKSSSSRFTDSGKYEPHFAPCFHLKEERSGDICNACVLLVKRFRKLPSGIQQRHWGHVVDARANTKVRPKLSVSEKVSQEEVLEDDVDGDDVDDDDDIKVSIRKKKKKNKERTSSSSSSSSSWSQRRTSPLSLKVPEAKLDDNMPSYLDPQLWRRETVCCGTIFRGPMNAIVIDMNLFRPCVSRRTSSMSSTSPSSLTTASPPPPATSPPSSQSPDSTSSASSHFKLDGGCGSGVSSMGEGSETGDGLLLEQTTFDRAFENKQNGHSSKMAVPIAL